MFARWKNLTFTDQLTGIREEELTEYKEAFRLFDKVRLTYHFYHFEIK